MSGPDDKKALHGTVRPPQAAAVELKMTLVFIQNKKDRDNKVKIIKLK